MKALLTFAACLLAIPGLVQAQRAVPGRSSVEAHRSMGEIRIWTFIQDDSTIGVLRSQVAGETEIDGISGYVIEEELTLDFTKVGQVSQIQVTGEHYIAADGSYLGDDIRVTVGERTGQLEMERDGARIVGKGRSGETSRDIDVPFAPGGFAIDNYMIDQYELYFAARGLREGDKIEDTIFVPRDQLTTVIKGEVVGWQWQQLWRGVLDSVFYVQLTQPATMQLFINRDLSLRKLYVPSQDLRVYLDVVTVQEQAQVESFGLSKIVTLIPHCLMYLVIGFVAILLFAGAQLRSPTVWLAAGVGGVSFVIIVLVQFPIQNYLFENVFGPRSGAGWSALPAAFLAVLPAGIVQEGLRLLGVFVMDKWRIIGRSRLPAIGAAIGGGMGIVEACYLDSVVPEALLFDWAFLQRILFIFFAATAGTFIGYGYRRAGTALWKWLLIALVLNVLLRLLPVFAQLRVMDSGLIYLTTGFIVVVLMLVGVMVLRREE